VSWFIDTKAKSIPREIVLIPLPRNRNKDWGLIRKLKKIKILKIKHKR